MITNETRYTRAKEKVEAIKSFYGNLLAYLIVIPALFWLNYHTTSFIWAIFPAIGWGVGLIINAWCVFAKNPFLGKEWEQRKIEQLMRSDNF